MPSSSPASISVRVLRIRMFETRRFRVEIAVYHTAYRNRAWRHRSSVHALTIQVNGQDIRIRKRGEMPAMRSNPIFARIKSKLCVNDCDLIPRLTGKIIPKSEANSDYSFFLSFYKDKKETYAD